MSLKPINWSDLAPLMLIRSTFKLNKTLNEKSFSWHGDGHWTVRTSEASHLCPLQCNETRGQCQPIRGLEWWLLTNQLPKLMMELIPRIVAALQFSWFINKPDTSFVRRRRRKKFPQSVFSFHWLLYAALRTLIKLCVFILLWFSRVFAAALIFNLRIRTKISEQNKLNLHSGLRSKPFLPSRLQSWCRVSYLHFTDEERREFSSVHSFKLDISRDLHDLECNR